MQASILRTLQILFVVSLLNFTAADQIPITGPENPAGAPYDALMINLLNRYGIPGGAVAVSRNGDLILSRAYGYADVSAKKAVQPDSLFRIASVSKPVTAVAVMKLVEDGKLRLEDHAFDLLTFGYGSDPRIRQITIRHLLNHSAGWDRDVSFDPMFHFGAAGAEEIIRQMLTRPLDFAPGARHAYSNFGYCVLGRVIERVTGRRYEDYVRDEILKPMKIESMRVGGRSGNAEREVHYYGSGAYNLLPDVMDAHGGWIASANDLVRFADALQARGRRPAFLKPETLATMIARPEPPLWEGSRQWYGLGWGVVPAGRSANIFHNGAMPGTASILVSTHHNYTWAAVFNQMPASLNSFMIDLDRGLWEASRTAWPPQSSARRKRPNGGRIGDNLSQSHEKTNAALYAGRRGVTPHCSARLSEVLPGVPL